MTTEIETTVLNETHVPVQSGSRREAMGEIFGEFVLRDRWKPNYRARPAGGEHFLSSDQGSWALLSEDDYRHLRGVALPRALHDHLEDRGLILTERNAERVMRSYEEWSSNYFPGTSLHIVGITRRCNLRCAYCHATVVPEDAPAERFDLDRDTARAIVDFAFQSPSDRIHFEFQGGEATLNFDTVKYVHTYASYRNLTERRRLTFSIVSNGVDLSPEVVDYLAAAHINVTVSVELAGEDEAPLRVDRQGRGHAADVARNRALLRERGILSPVLYVIGRNNVGHLRRYVDYAIEQEQDSIFFSPVQQLGFARKAWDQVGIEMDDFFTAWRDAMEYIFGWWDRGVLLEERYFSLALEKLFNGRDTRYMDFRNPSGMVLGNLAYDHRGDVYGCDEGRGHPAFRIGNVRSDSYDQVVTSEKARQLVAYSLREHDACQVCAYKPYCGVSPIVSKGECGQLDPVPLESSCCQRTLALFDHVLDIMREQPHRIDQGCAIIRMKSG